MNNIKKMTFLMKDSLKFKYTNDTMTVKHDYNYCRKHVYEYLIKSRGMFIKKQVMEK